MIKFDTFNYAYKRLLIMLLNEPLILIRGSNVREICPFSFTIDNPSSSPLVTGDAARDEILAKYLAKESKLFKLGLNKVDDMAEASKFWLKIQNPDGTVNSNYGRLIWHDKSCQNKKYSEDEMTPWEWAKRALTEDRYTRQSVITFLRPDHLWKGNKDMTCAIYGHFFIRPQDGVDKLSLQIRMRSQDVWLGMPYDLPWFMGLMENMVEELAQTYHGLELGSFHHSVDSFHLYERDETKIRQLLGQLS